MSEWDMTRTMTVNGILTSTMRGYNTFKALGDGPGRDPPTAGLYQIIWHQKTLGLGIQHL